MFDLDGTLVDTSGDIVRAANYVRSVEGLMPLTDEEILAAVGRGARWLVREVTDIGEEDKERLDALVSTYSGYYRRHQTEHSRPYPGVAEALASLGRRFDLYVLSNKPKEAVVREVTRHGLAPFLREVFGGGSFGGLKPDPSGVLHALEASGVPAARGIMVGDLAIDLETGIAAGVSTCFAAWGFSELKADDPEPTIRIESIAELEPRIEELWGLGDAV
ncbi:MAG: HAD hydrolase-like protein [Deltaproteobacteria bacterium]|nr:HAD hydrolase-like protein [Deltaproteobacteria bacterium]